MLIERTAIPMGTCNVDDILTRILIDSIFISQSDSLLLYIAAGQL